MRPVGFSGRQTHSSILAWRIPHPEEPGGLQSTGSQRVRHDWATNTFTFSVISTKINSILLQLSSETASWTRIFLILFNNGIDMSHLYIDVLSDSGFHPSLTSYFIMKHLHNEQGIFWHRDVLNESSLHKRIWACGSAGSSQAFAQSCNITVKQR